VTDTPYYHVIIKKFTKELPPGYWEKVHEICARIRVEVPGCLEFYQAPNVSGFKKTWTHIHLSKFTSKEAHDAYQVHPLHNLLVELSVPLMEAVVGDVDVALETAEGRNELPPDRARV
jgi:hypothetical protein